MIPKFLVFNIEDAIEDSLNNISSNDLPQC